MTQYALYNDSFFLFKPWWLPQKLWKVICNRSNPRTKEYMNNLLNESFPQAKLTNLKDLPQGTKELILLYPDSIGLGWTLIEKKLRRDIEKLIVLNGRKRRFELTGRIRNKLLLKRFFEITFLPEILFAPVFIFYALILVFKDKFIGNYEKK